MSAKQLQFAQLNEKDEIVNITTEPLTHNQIVRYAGASGDFNPIHNDPDFAKKVGLDGTIAHGMLIMGLIGKMITGYTDPKFVKNYNVKFVGMSKPGDALVLTSVVKKKDESTGKKLATLVVQAAGTGGDTKVKGEVVVECV